MQTILLDTCALLFAAQDEGKLGDQALSVLRDGTDELLLSPATYWEIAIKIKIGKLELDVEYDVFIDDCIRIFDLRILEVSTLHTSLLTTLELHHGDPFDRLLIVQSIYEGVPILSADRAFDKYPITRLWDGPTN